MSDIDDFKKHLKKIHIERRNKEMTELMELMNENREEALEKIAKMESTYLFAELDDTLQFDVCKVGNEDWTCKMHKQKKVYEAIINELRSRCRETK